MHHRRFQAAAFLFSIGSIALSACGPNAPAAEATKWRLTRETTGAGYVFDGNARLLGGKEGWFTPRLAYLDADGCQRTEYLAAVHAGTFPDPQDFAGKFHQRFDSKAKIARATLALVYRPAAAAPSDFGADRIVFTEERVIDPTLRPPVRNKPCPSANPETQVADFATKEEKAATLINLSGYLCGRVTDAYASAGGTITVHCTEFRDGRGRAKYRIYTDTAAVERIE